MFFCLERTKVLIINDLSYLQNVFHNEDVKEKRKTLNTKYKY